jgi:hypothetical protein
MGLKKLVTYHILHILHKGLLGREFRVMGRNAVPVSTKEAGTVAFCYGSEEY